MDSRPDYVREEHLRFLDALREDGAVNMFGAAPYLSETFGVDKTTARKIFGYWARTFSARREAEATGFEMLPEEER